MDTPKFSIVIPCYNQGAFLEECLSSISAQTLRPHQVLVVDDGSSDPWTVQRIDELCLPPVELVRQRNGGLSAARNAGIRRATGDWILPLDADDQLAPDALAAYAEAITRDPGVDIWYPDISHFGKETNTWELADFSPWRLLWSNQLVCSSAIRRRVFDADVHYNERMRGGYEDWEFYIHACCDRNFVAKPLKKPVFRYRRWGYSMLSASRERDTDLRAQIQQERPIYRNSTRLLEMKQANAPFFAISAQGTGLAEALADQPFRDYRVVDDENSVLRKGDLSVFHQHPGRSLLVSLADDVLCSAFRADPFLLEKIASNLCAHDPALVWLATVSDPGAAYPGRCLEPMKPDQFGQVACAGFVLNLRYFFARAQVAKTDGSLLWDLSTFVRRMAPDRIRHLIVGTHPGTELLQIPHLGRPAPIRTKLSPPIRERALHLGQGLSRIARGVLGPESHDRLWQNRSLLRVKELLDTQYVPMDIDVEQKASTRIGPLKLDRRSRHANWQVAEDEPIWPVPEPGTPPGILIAAPWIVHGGADRTIVDLLHGLRRIDKDVPVYLLTTAPHGSAPSGFTWADAVLPYVQGFFSLPDMAGKTTPEEALVRLVARLNIKSILINHSKEAFDALPKLKLLPNPPRTVAQIHVIGVDPKTGALEGYAFYAASHYNNLIDAYTPIATGLGDFLVKQLYVSPTKIKAVHLGIDVSWFANARRPRFCDDIPKKVLWLARLDEQKDPLTALRVAKLWKERHGTGRLQFILAGGGPLNDAVMRAFQRDGLEDIVTLVGATSNVVPLYRAADCLMMTSRYEGIPLVIYEAMAAGLPIITPTKNTFIEEVISGKDAYFVERSSDPEEYVSILEKMLTDRDEQQARAATLTKVSARYDIERYARDMLNILLPPVN